MNSWAEQIKADILNLKMRVTALETQVNAMKEGMLGSNTSTVKSAGSSGTGSSSLEKLSGGADSKGNTNFEQMSLDLAKVTYSIRTAETAAKGYLMLLGQMGLSADQKAMVRDLENINMAVMKTMATIKMLQLALASTNPYMMAFYLFSAGGTLAASVAYGNKVSGGGV
jgi:hypothetical protein